MAAHRPCPPLRRATRRAVGTLARSIVSILLLGAACSASESTPAPGSGTGKPAGTPHDPVEVCEKVGDVCRLDGARLGVCTQVPAGNSPAACAGREPCYLCMSQH